MEKVAAAILAGTMAFALAGCGSENKTVRLPEMVKKFT